MVKKQLKFIYSEKAIKFCEISNVDLTVTTYDKSTVEILQNFVAFSEYMNFKQSFLFKSFEEFHVQKRYSAWINPLFSAIYSSTRDFNLEGIFLCQP